MRTFPIVSQWIRLSATYRDLLVPPAVPTYPSFQACYPRSSILFLIQSDHSAPDSPILRFVPVHFPSIEWKRDDMDLSHLNSYRAIFSQQFPLEKGPRQEENPYCSTGSENSDNPWNALENIYRKVDAEKITKEKEIRIRMVHRSVKMLLPDLKPRGNSRKY